ncbi:GLPGLI family protein [Chryseobacterium arthrosphaerae]|uniref:GLPGLI family protein n=1 Tax=Chryseobacterium arthrosphaerae TaxID=651561 RepID=UPI0023E2FA59|nr:GLPGLI family protein [Chryseobacterium arthrosphaerae]WES97383.1 GLPGLI family protein [Chryseobacterium arthrosphaerae]
MINKLFFLFVLFISNLLLSQDVDTSYIKVDYEAVFLIDTANVSSRKTENTTLLIGKRSSYFKSSYKEIADSIGKQIAKKSLETPVNGQVILNTGLLPSAKFKPEVYYIGVKSIIYDLIGRDAYSFEGPNTINWQIENIRKKINGFDCQKAVTMYGRKKITAWFTSEIPISEGPYTFKGLPGLVLEAYDDKEYFHFKLSGLKKDVKISIGNIPFSVKTSYEKFFKKRKDMMADPINSFISVFNKRPPKENEEQIIRNIRRLNNHLD